MLAPLALLSLQSLAAIIPQVLYLRWARRFDFSAPWFILVGICLGALHMERAVVLRAVLLELLLYLTVGAVFLFLVRWRALNSEQEWAFMLVSLGAGWACPGVLRLAMGRHSQYGSLSFSGESHLYLAWAGAAAIAAAAGGTIASSNLPLALRAMADNIRGFRCVVGQTIWFTLLSEGIAVLLYVIGGFVISFGLNSLSPALIEEELPWIMLAPALVPKGRLTFALVGPVAVALMRFATAEVIPSTLMAPTGYVLAGSLISLSVVLDQRHARARS